MNKKLFSLFIVSSFLAITMPLIHAEESDTSESDKVKRQYNSDRMEKKPELMDEKKEERCDKFLTKLTARQDRHQDIKERMLSRYSNRITRLENIVEKLEGTDIDTTNLEAKIAELKIMVEDIKVEYQKLLAIMEEIKGMKCGDEDANLREIIQRAHAQMEVVHNMSKEIKAFYQDEIKPILKELKAQLASSKGNE